MSANSNERRNALLYVVTMEDEPKNADARPKHQDAHRAYLEGILGKLRSAGPLTDPKTGGAAGALWMIEASGPDEVQKLLEADPFYKAGLRKNIRIAAWKQVFADGKRIA